MKFLKMLFAGLSLCGIEFDSMLINVGFVVDRFTRIIVEALRQVPVRVISYNHISFISN